jgi:hypothetical protein
VDQTWTRPAAQACPGDRPATAPHPTGEVGTEGWLHDRRIDRGSAAALAAAAGADSTIVATSVAVRWDSTSTGWGQIAGPIFCYSRNKAFTASLGSNVGLAAIRLRRGLAAPATDRY